MPRGRAGVKINLQPIQNKCLTLRTASYIVRPMNTTPQRRGLLRQAIFEYGLQKKFAEACDLSESALSGFIRGRMNPDVDQVARMCRVLGRTARSLDL